MKHGFGKFTWKDGRSYEGAWRDGERDGIAYYLNSKGVKRKGEWVKGKRIKWLEDPIDDSGI